ncbi:hypothetical protein [Nocardioides mangrovi]|uniref:Terpene cyclase/mutase family protein n=1 Tax=Nocardioides mangrovi TaxID=2874580 RepID=A0ABS7U8B9_9ACTN|nr:hypothetical protein [Nocardioides mangrovi]MBZ5737223.1 hypothetical protein [Nocardioides mangrovi]
MRPTLRGAAAVLAVPALAMSALAATSAPASADATTDPAPATAAGYWLGGQLTDGLVHNRQYDFDDYGLTIDVGLAFHTLESAGAPHSVVEGISDAMAAAIDSYVAPGYGTDLSAGSAAKAAVLAQAAGDDATAYGGRDLISDLESTVGDDGALAGRIQDDWDPTVQYAADYANVLGQAFAAEALDAAGSAKTDAVTDFLLQQQCADGYFRQDFTVDLEADQTCDGSDGQPNVDATALAIEALQSQLDDADVAAQVAKAVDWLVDQQKANGGFGSDADIPTANANSTGAAAYALLISGQPEAAARAAAWLRAHQATNVATCVSYDDADAGAVTYDDAALANAQKHAMGKAKHDQAVRATAQALPGLLAAQTSADEPQAHFTSEYVKAGGAKPVGVTDAAPGEALCAMRGEQSVLGYAGVDGEVDLKVAIPDKTKVSKVKVANAGGTFDTVAINALGAKKLTVSLKKRSVAKGGRQVIRVSGLAPGETVLVDVTWPSTAHSGSGTSAFGQANGQGVVRTSLTASKHAGTARVKVKGAFANRKAKASFTVR